MELYIRANDEYGLKDEEIRGALLKSIEGRSVRKALILPPDFTRFHSNAGLITNIYYHELTRRGAEVDVMPTLGTHAPMTREQCERMFGDIPFERFFVHDWRRTMCRRLPKGSLRTR